MLKKIHYLFIFIFYLCLASGCAKSIIPLEYASMPDNYIPVAGATEVTVATFQDSRTSPVIGRRSDGTDFMPSSDIADWLANGLAVELAGQGYVVTRAESESAAKIAGARNIISGTIEEVWIEEKSSAEYDARMRATLSIKSSGKSLSSRSFSSAYAKTGVPFSDVPQVVMRETLRELVQPMMRTITENLHP